MTFSQLRIDLGNICKSYKLGYLVNYETKEHPTLKGYEVCIFETSESEKKLEYIYLKNRFN